MHDPHTVAFQIGKHGSICTIWHRDPELDGTDDSCGWFIRPRHCDKAVLEKIVKAFDFEWGQRDSDKDRATWFNTDGTVRLSRIGVVLDMYTHAAYWVFNRNRDKAHKWVQNNLAHILHFAENNVDSIGDGMKYISKYPNDCTREERISMYAGIVHSDIMRKLRPWYRHPRWHVQHWRLQFPWLQSFKRWAFSRCAHCGGMFKYGYAPTSHQWHQGGPRWFRNGEVVYHHECSNELMKLNGQNSATSAEGK